jgi:hypothetical protein
LVLPLLLLPLVLPVGLESLRSRGAMVIKVVSDVQVTASEKVFSRLILCGTGTSQCHSGRFDLILTNYSLFRVVPPKEVVPSLTIY